MDNKISWSTIDDEEIIVKQDKKSFVLEPRVPTICIASENDQVIARQDLSVIVDKFIAMDVPYPDLHLPDKYQQLEAIQNLKSPITVTNYYLCGYTDSKFMPPLYSEVGSKGRGKPVVIKEENYIQTSAIISHYEKITNWLSNPQMLLASLRDVYSESTSISWDDLYLATRPMNSPYSVMAYKTIINELLTSLTDRKCLDLHPTDGARFIAALSVGMDYSVREGNDILVQISKDFSTPILPEKGLYDIVFGDETSKYMWKMVKPGGFLILSMYDTNQEKVCKNVNEEIDKNKDASWIGTIGCQSAKDYYPIWIWQKKAPSAVHKWFARKPSVGGRGKRH